MVKPQFPPITVVTPCKRRRRQRGVPEHLRVVVRVDVDEARRDDLALGVDRARRLLVDVADRRDPAVADSDVGDPAGRTRAVDDRATADDHVEHDPTIVQPPWVMHLRVGLPSSPGHHAESAPRSRAGSRPRVRRSRSWPGASSRARAATSPGSLRETADAIAAAGGAALPIVADLADPAVRSRRDRRPRRGRARPGRRARQQRGRVLLPEHRRDVGAAAARRVRSERHHAVPADEGGRAGDARARRGLDRQHHERDRRHQPARQSAAGALVDVRAEQGRARPADDLVRDRAARNGHRGERARARTRGRHRGRHRGDGSSARVVRAGRGDGRRRRVALATCDPERENGLVVRSGPYLRERGLVS